MNMKTKARRTGGSITIVLPAEVVRQLGITEGDELDVAVTAGKATIEPHRTAIAKVIDEWRKHPIIPDRARALAVADEAVRLIDEGRDEDHLDRSYLERGT